MTAIIDTYHAAVIVGAPRVGKTQLLRALVGDPEAHVDLVYRATLGAEQASLEAVVNGDRVSVSLTSTSGNLELLPLTQMHLHGKKICIIVYNVNDLSLIHI